MKILILSHPNDWHAVCNHSVSCGGSANMEREGSAHWEMGMPSPFKPAKRIGRLQGCFAKSAFCRIVTE